MNVETEKWFVEYPMMHSIWYHFVTTWHQAKGARMYKDGILVATENAPVAKTYNPAGYDNVVLGAPNHSPSSFGEVWIDDVISCEHIVDDEYIKYLYLSSYYWADQNKYYFKNKNITVTS